MSNLLLKFEIMKLKDLDESKSPVVHIDNSLENIVLDLAISSLSGQYIYPAAQPGVGWLT